MSYAFVLDSCSVESNNQVYNPALPDFAIEYLVTLGNTVNSEVENTTFLQFYRRTPKVEEGRAKKKKDSEWNVANLGQGA